VRKRRASMIVGYGRTSTAEQLAGLDAQIRDLKAAGAEKLFSEQISSVAKRPALEACLDFVREGDVLTVTKPDRLARSTQNLLEIVTDLDRRKVGLVILSMGGEKLDTRNPTSRLMLTMLAAVAEFERNLMRERQIEGIAKAKSDGKYQGRPRRPELMPDVIKARLANGEKHSDIARSLGVARSSVYRVIGPTT
jgi:DNA invertase Pin-like site-specific DNA recombinase